MVTWLPHPDGIMFYLLGFINGAFGHDNAVVSYPGLKTLPGGRPGWLTAPPGNPVGDCGRHRDCGWKGTLPPDICCRQKGERAAPLHGLSGLTTLPMKRIAPESFSTMRKTNG
jgi:hypothetical protein